MYTARASEEWRAALTSIYGELAPLSLTRERTRIQSVIRVLSR